MVSVFLPDTTIYITVNDFVKNTCTLVKQKYVMTISHMHPFTAHGHNNNTPIDGHVLRMSEKWMCQKVG